MKYRISAVLCMVMLLLAGCSSKSGKNTDETLETVVVYQALPLPDIFVDIPESFEETSSQFYEKYYICEDASIIVTEDKNGPFPSAYDYSLSALEQYRSVANTLEVLSQDALTAKNCGIQMIEFNYTLGENNDTQMSTMVGFVTDGDSMYIITCKSNTSTYAEYQNAFRTVMESVMLAE